MIFALPLSLLVLSSVGASLIRSPSSRPEFRSRFLAKNAYYIDLPKDMPLTPTLFPSKTFNATADAQKLHAAMKGLGTDEEAIINILTKRSSQQRFEIGERYAGIFGKALSDDLRGDLSGNLMNAMLALTLPTKSFYASELNRAVKGLGTKEDVLIEILCSLTKKDLEEVREVYEKNYAPLIGDIESDTSGDFRDFLVALLVTDRDDSKTVDQQKAIEDARALYDAGEDQWGTEEGVFYNIFATRNFDQLRLVFDEYLRLAYHSIDVAIEEEFSGDIKKALLTFVNVVRNLHGYFATRLHDSMVFLGTRDRTLMRIIITRCEVDLRNIMREYYNLYDQILEADIVDDTFLEGNYRMTLLGLLGYE